MDAEATAPDARPWHIAAMATGLGALSWLGSHAPIKQDDFGFLAWGIQDVDGLADALAGPAWSAHERPLNALVWWFTARYGVGADIARTALATMWTVCSVLICATAFRRRGAGGLVLALVLLLGNQVFVDLLQWRSWLTTTGTLVGLAGGATWIAARSESKRGPFVLIALGALAAGFKETGAFALGLLAVGACRGTSRAIGAILLATALAIGSLASHKVGLDRFDINLAYHLETLGGWAWSIPVLVAVRAPRASAWVVASLGLVSLLPPQAAGMGTLCAAAFLLTAAPTWGLAVASAWALPLFGSAHARQYLLEGWILLVVATVHVVSSRPRAIALVVAAATAIPGAIEHTRQRVREAAMYDEQLRFLDSFGPPPARVLYRPRPDWALDLDALVWMERGAVLDGEPPEGSKPVATGPLSGVWADIVQNGSGSSTTEPAAVPPKSVP